MVQVLTAPTCEARGIFISGQRGMISSITYYYKCTAYVYDVSCLLYAVAVSTVPAQAVIVVYSTYPQLGMYP